jgi:hypothetical protein
MTAMTLSRLVSLASAVLVGASLSLAPVAGYAGPGPSGPSEPSKTDAPVEGPARPPAAPPAEQPDAPPAEQPPVDPDAPTGELIPPPPTYDPGSSPDSPGIEFVVPPPESEDEQQVDERESPLAATFPDPGHAPSDGVGILVLSSTTIALTGLGFGVGLTVGLQNQTPLEWLLPSTLIPTIGLLAFSGGGLYLGIKRARAYRRWEIGHRVIGEPQGGGLKIGASFMLLGALGLIPSGAFALANGDDQTGAIMLALGGAAALATPIMFTVAARRSQNHARTGGWHRRPIPPIPGQSGVRLQVTPLVVPTLDGVMIGGAGRF